MDSTRPPRIIVALLAGLLMAAACTRPTPSPSSHMPATAAPSATPQQGPTAEDTPPATPAPTAEDTPPAAPVPTASPAESPPPSEQLSAALALQHNGEYEAAAAAFRALLGAGPAAETARRALLGLGQAELQAGAYHAAADDLARFIATYPQDADAPRASFWLGESLAGAGRGPEAVAAYQRYLQAHPGLSSYVQAHIGDALEAAGDHAGAAAAYRAAADAEGTAAAKADYLERLARSLQAGQRYDDCLAAYDEILQLAKIATYRAQIMYEAGRALADAGRKEEAAARWNALLAAYPTSSYAAQALPTLEAWGLATADALVRARVDYAAGRYDQALATLRHYLAAGPADPAAAHFYAALSYRGLGQLTSSLAEFDALFQGHPQSSLLVEARYQRAETLAALGTVDDAALAFRSLAQAFPQQDRAVQALWRAAEVYDDAGRSWDASAAYVQAVATYPGASYAADARFRAGYTHYLQGAVQTAAQTWAQHLPQEKDPAMRARLLLWLGKAAQRLGDGGGARDWWAQAVAANPNGFWGYRAQDLMLGRGFRGQAPAGAFDPARYAPRGDQAEAEAWLAGWAGGQLPRTLPASITGLEAFQRGMELWELGDGAAAMTELRQVPAACNDDPRTLYALALYARDQGAYLVSTVAAARVLDLAPAAARGSVPRFIEEMAYPTYYAGLVLREAQPTNTDPLLFFALTRQESLFDSQATSRSDARGLAQVIPSTGKYIADQLGDSAYTPERLWWPAVSVRYGLWYLSSALRMFDDDALMALVAYNAGPRNAASWGKLANGDDDVFFEQVSSSQPRTYMQRIYENRAHYERLYR